MAAPVTAPGTGTNSLVTAITAPVTDLAGNTIGTFTGTFTITRFVNQSGTLAATGTLQGTVTDLAGNIIRTVNETITTAITVAQASCTILSLKTGRITLNLLGLVIDIAPLDIVIRAEQGPGNLLGNLLCAIANLFNNPTGNLDLLVNLLNRILNLLR
jgi:phage-related minor tail protein